MTRKTFANESHRAKAGRRLPLQMLAAAGLLVGAGLMQSCDKDILTGQPSWLGNSIYERLEEGIDGKSFNTTLRLIDDLGQKEVLSQTGSKTVFATSDEDYAKWFANNTWGVSKYEDLSLAQKKMLFNNSMINNAYLIELMSNVSGNPPQEGLCMRRPTAASIQDTVGVMTVAEMPVDPFNDSRRDAWKSFRETGRDIRIFKDATTAPMLHFLPAFMEKNNITGEDLAVLTGGVSTSVSDSWINGKKVISSEQTCKNGYVYVVDGVIESNRNMAQIINDTPEMSEWAKLLGRFSYPDFDVTANREYNRLNGINATDSSVYVLRYFSDCGYGTSGNTNVKRNKTPNGVTVPATLTFDPGWNQYMYANAMGYDMHYDAAAMIVPTNEALENWWNTAGAGLKQEYGTLENVPALTLSKLLRVNMLQSFVDYVPSKFGNIVDDSKVTLGITPADVQKVYMGCNGVVYLVNRVFGPSEYRSVSYPALASQSTMGVIYWAIDNLDFGPFLNSMDSRYSLILPTNQGMLNYIDPCTYGLGQQMLYSFYFNDDEQNVACMRTLGIVDENGVFQPTAELTPLDPSNSVAKTQIENRLKDLVDNLIIVGDIEDGSKYYKTKAGSYVKVDCTGGVVTGVYGGYQMETGTPVQITTVYDMTNGGNGKSYGCDDLPMTSQHTVYEVLKKHSSEGKDSLFYTLLSGDETKEALLQNQQGTSTVYYCANDASNFNMRLFDNYNYTVYVPTDAAIKKLIDDGYLPTWEDYMQYAEGIERNDKASIAAGKVIAERIRNFLRYHVQDNSVFIGANNGSEATKYETGMLNEATHKFYSLEVESSSNGLVVKDQLKNHRNVITSGSKACYNQVAREYWMTKVSTKTQVQDQNRNLYSSSNAVVHFIDDVLLYSNSQLTSWKSEVEAAKAAATATTSARARRNK